MNFDRKNQILYYKSNGTIIDSLNTLTSKIGYYHLNTKKFIAKQNVVLTNPDFVLNSKHLDYYTNTKIAYLYGPSTIVSDESTIYSERGFYDTQKDIAHFLIKAKIISKNQVIEGDSIYYNKPLGFLSVTGNVVITDSTNNTITKGGYAENFEFKDSSFVTKRAVAIIISDTDSLFIHGDTLVLTGKKEHRKLRAFHNVKFYKPDLQGKCDSIFSDNSTGITTMFKNPVLWTNDSQITGDIIHFTRDLKTNKLDSLKVLKNALIVQKDSAGFNQIKGRTILGKFRDNDLRNLDVIGNSEALFYIRNDEGQLVGINKSTSSRILFKLKNGEIQTKKGITFNPFLKTKLTGVLGSSFLRAGDNPYRTIYDDYKHRLENHPAHKEKTKLHRHNMAIRYMIKRFLVDLYTEWRAIEGLPVAMEYSEAKLNMKHKAA